MIASCFTLLLVVAPIVAVAAPFLRRRCGGDIDIRIRKLGVGLFRSRDHASRWLRRKRLAQVQERDYSRSWARWLPQSVFSKVVAGSVKAFMYSPDARWSVLRALRACDILRPIPSAFYPPVKDVYAGGKMLGAEVIGRLGDEDDRRGLKTRLRRCSQERKRKNMSTLNPSLSLFDAKCSHTRKSITDN